VLSLNVLHGFPRFEHLGHRLDLIASEVRRLDPDIVCLQEVPWRPGIGNAAAFLAAETGLNHLYLRANGGRRAILFEEGVAILSRYPLRDVGFVVLTPSAGLFEHRVALRATADTPSGDVQVFVTHLTHRKPDMNRGQTESLKAFVTASAAGVPAIVAGDFNATEDSIQVRGLGWIDTYSEANQIAPGYTCCVDDVAAPRGEPFRERIDYVFLVADAAEAVVVESRRVFADPFRTDWGWLWASDHAGVFSILSLSGRERASAPGD
jgi:endonuclease/exonuclease/phosphatase family metal-dependent hydrolase